YAVLASAEQVAPHMLGRDACQETGGGGVTAPVTKQSALVRDVAELADVVREAMAIAVEGRPGPVLVDVPKDVQNQKAEYESRAIRPAKAPREAGRPLNDDALRDIARLIASAERP